MSGKLITAFALMSLLWPSLALPAGQPTAVSNLPVALTGRHKQHGKHPSKQPPAAKKAAGDGAGGSGEKK